jgi:uncharacterized membrane protein
MLPKSLDPDTLRTVAIVALAALVLLALLVMRFIQKMVLRVLLIGALAGLGVFVYIQRDDLSACVPECACEFFGYEVQVPECRALVDPDQP